MKDLVIECKNLSNEFVSSLFNKKAKKESLGKTELGRIIQHTDGRFNGATVQLPTTNYHTNHETTSELAVNNYYNALKAIL